MGGIHELALCVAVAAGIASSWGVEGRYVVRERDCGSAAPALFVFGASYLDVGENFAAMPFRSQSDFLPYGMDFFGKPTGRYSNGRTIMDHISAGLGREFLSPYLRDMGTTFEHGVNFASSGSRACNSSIRGDGSDSSGLFSLHIQMDQFRVFRQQTLLLDNAKEDARKVGLPTASAFSTGVYIIESGNNDYIDHYEQSEGKIPLVLNSIEHSVRTLYNEGARTIVLMDVFPVACFPCIVAYCTPDQLNQDGCMTSAVKIIELHNAGLRAMVKKLKVELKEANLTIFSLYDIFMSAFRNPSQFGLKNVNRACCGYYGRNMTLDCGKYGYVNGEWTKGTVCSNRSEYMLWDCLHPTDAFASQIAQAFLRGEYMHPPLRVKELCRREQQ